MKKNKLAIILYVFGCLSFAYVGFTLYKSYDYIKGLIGYGTLTLSDSMSDVIQYVVGNSFEYLVYGLVLIALGYLIQKLVQPKVIETTPVEETSKEVETKDEPQTSQEVEEASQEAEDTVEAG